MTKKEIIICEKLKKFISKNQDSMYPEKDIEINNAKIKNITQAYASAGVNENNFIGMLTITFGKNKYERVFPNDYLKTIIRKTQIMYHSSLFFLNELKTSITKKGFDIIYLAAFELQKDGNLHMHIYFSLPIEAFEILFKFYHNYYNLYIETTKVTLNKKIVDIIPLGRGQLGVAYQFKKRLEKRGYIFKKHINPRTKREEYRCINLVSEKEFFSGAWPTLYFYTNENLQKNYEKKIVKYLTKSYTKTIRQQVIGSQFIKHNTKIVYDKEECLEIQKKFIQKVCGRLYVASRLPISISLYQKHRKKILKAYPPYKNLNTLITDFLNKKAYYNKKRGTLICPNGEKLILK